MFIRLLGVSVKNITFDRLDVKKFTYRMDYSEL